MAKVRRPINAPSSGKIPKELGIIVLVVAAAAAYYLGTRDTADEADTATASDDAYSVAAAAHGPADAPVVLAKWTDFQ